MKKAISILVFAFSIHTVSAHVTVTQHTHDSLVSELSWIVIPSIILIALIWKFGRKNYLKTTKR